MRSRVSEVHTKPTCFVDMFIGFYLLSNYIGKPLEVVHREIPYFNEKILMSVERTLKRFKATEPFERTSWTMVDDRNLFWRKFFCDLGRRCANEYFNR